LTIGVKRQMLGRAFDVFVVEVNRRKPQHDFPGARSTLKHRPRR
jgi:hypothetical protein